jgi:hypothetical protein
MVLIGQSYYSPSLQPFIEHKNNRGINTIFVSVDDVYTGTYFPAKGRDNQEKIKYFIKDIIENWGVVYVLFVGSADQVPVRYSYTDDNYSAHPEPKFISDLYYADIYDSSGGFSSWDNDGDDIFGEWIGDFAEDGPIDLSPDVRLGRLACVDETELDIIVNKIINYENKPADDSWFKRMVVVGGDTYDEFSGYEGEIYNQMALDAVEGFTPVKLWASTGALTKKPWSIVREINKGCGFVYFSGHGNSKLWATYSSDGLVGNFGLFDMLFLFNQNKLPICFVEGCQNSKFDAISDNVKGGSWRIFRFWFNSCWSWRLVTVPYGGAIATIGSTGLCWYSAEYDGAGSNWLTLQFFKEYAKGERVLGDIWMKCLNGFLYENPINWNTPSGGGSCIDAKTVQEWTLLGDPSLTIGGGVVK